MGIIYDWCLDESMNQIEISKRLFDMRKKLIPRQNSSDQQKRSEAEYQLFLVNSLQDSIDKMSNDFPNVQMIVSAYDVAIDNKAFDKVFKSTIDRAILGSGRDAFDIANIIREYGKVNIVTQWIFWAANCGEVYTYQICGSLLKTIKLDEAIRWYEKAERANAIDSMHIYEWGVIHWQRGERQKAYEKFQKAFDDGFVEAAKGLAMVYEYEGMYEKALELYRYAQKNGIEGLQKDIDRTIKSINDQKKEMEKKKEKKQSYVFGIDLGTTYSCISYVDKYGKAVVVKNSEGDHTTPSVVMVESKEDIVVGTEAKRSIEIEPNKTVQFIKRKMGKKQDIVKLNGIAYHAPEISAMILKKIVNDANEELRQTGVLKHGEEIKDVVITCPAYFGTNERQATKTAGELAGLNVLNIINEPTAAAISYGVSGSEKDETVLVYDLGGGTFDITVMNVQGNNISVICTGGDDLLGGKDWDEALMNYVVERYEEECEEDLSEDPDAIASLYVDVETWKKALTSRDKVNISVNGPGGRFREVLTRENFEKMTSRLLTRTKNLLDDVLEASRRKGYPLEKIDKILLVGGSSRMPQVAEMLEKHYGVTPILSDPDEAVSKGAAIYASNEKAYNDFIENEASQTGKSVDEIKKNNLLDGELDRKYANSQEAGIGGSRINVTNVLSRTYGIEMLIDGANKISNLLMINDKLPAKAYKWIQTASDNQKLWRVVVHESRSTEEYMEIDGREPVASAIMEFKMALPKGTPIAIMFALDNSGLIHILGKEQMYNTTIETTIQLSNEMEEDEMKKAVNRMSSATIE